MTNDNDLKKLGVDNSIAEHLWQFLEKKSRAYVGFLGAIFVTLTFLVVFSVVMENWLLCCSPFTAIVVPGVIAGILGGKLGGKFGLWIGKSTKKGETLGAIVGGMVFAFLAIAVSFLLMVVLLLSAYT